MRSSTCVECTNAVPYLESALALAPRSSHLRLLAGKAYLKTGDIESAEKWLVDWTFDENDHEFREVQALHASIVAALDEFDQADVLAFEQNKPSEALPLARKAASHYPELEAGKEFVRQVEIASAFETEDYETFAQLSEAAWREHPTALSAEVYASALAARYATSGEEQYREQAKAMLAEALQLCITEDEKMAYAEYGERIKHRLSSREIIDKREYDRRFRSATQASPAEKRN